MPSGRLSRFKSTDVLRSTYFSYVHLIISNGIIFWGKSAHSEDIFKIQKRIIRIIMSSGKKASCWQLFRELNILPVQSQYILSILLFVTKNKNQFISNSQVHTINTRQTSDLYIPIANLRAYKKVLITKELRFTIICPKILKTYPAIRINLNLH
jgi:hypothetical protein